MTPAPTRRDALKAVAAGIFTATAGCLNLEGIEGGLLTVRWAAKPPAEATVVSMADERVAGIVVLQTVTQRVSESNPQEQFDLTRTQYNEVTDALAEVPHHDGVGAGYYLENRGDVYRLQYTPYCTRVPGVESRNEGRCVVGESDSNPEPALDRP
ncbi:MULTISPECIES: hypothetical protein [unclassified Haladaptatus]|uniref:hypothetical protein n=1 Tax=unclassified Haladaptatus TaxID=2622732 RepID=UPI0023E764C5|nr:MULTISPECIES: hypothetical protein [unclassified Haladaptatus]